MLANLNRQKVVLILILIVILGSAVYFIEHSKNIFMAGTAPPQGVIRVISQYVQASEDSIGSDQSSPTSWTNSVKPIVSTQWLTNLSPGSTGTSNVSAEYYLAHQNGLSVKATISNCVWAAQPINPTPQKGYVFCSVSDTTTNQSGSPVSGQSLPFGWTHSGAESPITVELLNRQGNWIINSVDISS